MSNKDEAEVLESKILKLVLTYSEEIIGVAVLIGGMSLQYLFGERRGFAAFYTVVVATILMAYITTNLMNWLEVPLDSALRNLGLAFSSITGMALISWGIKAAPPLLQERLVRFFKGSGE